MNVFEDLTIDHAYNVHNSQCSAADCVLIFLGAAACTAPKFYIFTESKCVCVLFNAMRGSAKTSNNFNVN